MIGLVNVLAVVGPGHPRFRKVVCKHPVKPVPRSKTRGRPGYKQRDGPSGRGTRYGWAPIVGKKSLEGLAASLSWCRGKGLASQTIRFPRTLVWQSESSPFALSM